MSTPSLRDALKRIASFKLSQFMGPHDMALECVHAAKAALAKQTEPTEPSDCDSCGGTGSGGMGVGCTDCLGTGIDPNSAAPTARAQAEPTSDDFERLWNDYQGHPQEFAAEVLERWGAWPHGKLPAEQAAPKAEPRPLFDPEFPNQGYVSDAEWAARKAGSPAELLTKIEG